MNNITWIFHKAAEFVDPDLWYLQLAIIAGLLLVSYFIVKRTRYIRRYRPLFTVVVAGILWIIPSCTLLLLSESYDMLYRFTDSILTTFLLINITMFYSAFYSLLAIIALFLFRKTRRYFAPQHS